MSNFARLFGTTKRLADLAHALVGDPDHRHLMPPAGCSSISRLDLGRIAVEAADDVHVLDPVGDLQIAAFVEHADVAGVQPAVRASIASARRRIVLEVARPSRCSRCTWISPGSPRGDRLARRGPTHRTSTPSIARARQCWRCVSGSSLGSADGDERGRLGEAVCGEDRCSTLASSRSCADQLRTGTTLPRRCRRARRLRQVALRRCGARRAAR